MREVKATLLAMGFAPVPVMRAIRAKCLDCSGGSHVEVADCLVTTCPLYPFRLGTNPWRAERSDAQREASQKALAKAKSPPSLGASADEAEATGCNDA